MVLNQVYIFSDIIIYLWDKRSNWSTKNIYDWVTYNRANSIVEQFLNQFWNDGEISDIFLSRTFCPVCIIEFGHTDILSDYVRLPMQIKNPVGHNELRIISNVSFAVIWTTTPLTIRSFVPTSSSLWCWTWHIMQIPSSAPLRWKPSWVCTKVANFASVYIYSISVESIW